MIFSVLTSQTAFLANRTAFHVDSARHSGDWHHFFEAHAAVGVKLLWAGNNSCRTHLLLAWMPDSRCVPASHRTCGGPEPVLRADNQSKKTVRDRQDLKEQSPVAVKRVRVLELVQQQLELAQLMLELVQVVVVVGVVVVAEVGAWACVCDVATNRQPIQANHKLPLPRQAVPCLWVWCPPKPLHNWP